MAKDFQESTCSILCGILICRFGTQRPVCCFRQSHFCRRAVSWKWVRISIVWRVVPFRVLHLAKDQEELIKKRKVGKLPAAKPFFLRRYSRGAFSGGDSRSCSPREDVKLLLEKKVRSNARCLLDEFCSTILLTVAARSKQGQGVSCFRP